MKTTAMPELPPGHQNHFSLAENCPKSKGVFQKSLAEPKYSWSGIQTHLELQPRKAQVVSQSPLSSPHFQGTENTENKHRGLGVKEAVPLHLLPFAHAPRALPASTGVPVPSSTSLEAQHQLEAAPLLHRALPQQGDPSAGTDALCPFLVASGLGTSGQRGTKAASCLEFGTAAPTARWLSCK